MVEDYLALPADAPEAEKNPDLLFNERLAVIHREREQAVATKAVARVRSNLPARIAPTDVPAAPEGATRSAMLEKAWCCLTKSQQTFLTLLRENKFNERATVRFLELTPDSVSRTTVRNWKNSDANFSFVLKILKTFDAGDAIDRERLLLRAEEIAESALEPTPILYQGAPTGFYENSKDTALRANEQLMKAAGMLKGDEKNTRVVVRVVNLAGPDDDKPPAIDVGVES